MIIFAYLTWNPSPTMFEFNLPILGRPVLWYGLFFAFGFFLGYLVLLYLLRRYLAVRPAFSPYDIASWPDILKWLSVRSSQAAKTAFSLLVPAHQRICSAWSPGNVVPKETMEAIISALNATLTDPKAELNIPLPTLSERILRYAGKRLDQAALRQVRIRLEIEASLGKAIASFKVRATRLAEKLTFYVIIGALVGARLGDILFYQNWHDIVKDPLSIIAIWHGGLASHGGAIGILIALWVFSRKMRLPFWTAVDFTVIPTAIAAASIRIGNFFNQEILGVPTTLPWGILFLHPADGGPVVPRHPAQLYESAWYLCVFVLLLLYWHRRAPFEKVGKLTGLFLILVFVFRFLIEFIKVEQSVYLSAGSPLTMGQYLSLPFIVLGLYLLFRKS